MINHPHRNKKAKKNTQAVSLNPTMTLAQIRAKGPCAPGWTKLLVGLGYANGEFYPDRVVSLGDIATINDAADALWWKI